MPVSSRRVPSSGSSSISTSPISALVVGSHPGNSMPAALRTTLRPPSHPTRYRARSDPPSESATSTPVVVLREARHLAAAVEGDGQLVDPAGQDALDVVLPQPEPVGVAGGEAGEVEPGAAERGDLGHLPLRQEPLGDPALVEHLDRARVQAARARAGELLVLASLDDGDVDPRQGQLGPPASAPSDRLPRPPPHALQQPSSAPLIRLLRPLRRASMRAHPGACFKPPTQVYIGGGEGAGGGHATRKAGQHARSHPVLLRRGRVRRSSTSSTSARMR